MWRALLERAEVGLWGENLLSPTDCFLLHQLQRKPEALAGQSQPHLDRPSQPALVLPEIPQMALGLWRATLPCVTRWARLFTGFLLQCTSQTWHPALCQPL